MRSVVGLCFGVMLASACAPVEPAMELGTGLTAFEPIVDGQDLPMIEGAQGGWHVWLSLRVRGLESPVVHVALVTEPLPAERPRQTTFLDISLQPAGEWDEVVGVAAVFTAPECFQDHDVRLSATVTDPTGATLADERVAIPRWPEPIGACEHDL